MITRTRTACDRRRQPTPELPARRSPCRRERLDFTERLYIVVPEGDGAAIDVLEDGGTFLSRFFVPDRLAAAETLLRDATGAAPRPATAAAFADELLHAALDGEGLALTSGEVCAWLLLRAIG